VLRKSKIFWIQAFIVEVSKNGVTTSKAAGIRTIITTNSYTEQKDVSAVDAIITYLGDPKARELSCEWKSIGLRERSPCEAVGGTI